MNIRLHRIIRWTFLLTLVIVVSVIGQATTSSPTHLKVGLYKTELYNGAAWTMVFDTVTPVPIDLVTSPGSVFGSGSIPVGTYDKIRLTLKNEILYSGLDGACAATDASLLVDNELGAAAPVTLTFATADAGGGTSWYSNGSDAHPLLMVGSVDVAAGATTRVNLIFNTASTLLCDAGVFALNAPTVSVASYVVPAATAFAGGDYWAMHYGAALNTSFLGRNPDGTLIPPSTESEWALVRRYTRYVSGWGFKIHFDPPDPTSGAGIATFIQDGIEHRHRVDQSGGCTDCGAIAGGTVGAVLNYTISADNRLTISEPGGTGAFWGAFSRDFNVLIGVNMEGGNEGQDMVLGVKAATAVQTMAGLSAWNGYGADFDFPIPPGAVGGVASHLGISGDFGWIDLTTSPSNLEFSSHVSISDPALLTAFANAATFNHSGGGPALTSIPVGADGIYTLSDGEGLWLALSPDGNVAIVASGTNDIDADRSTSINERHHLGYGLVLKQAAAGTYTAASVAGTYIVAAAWDEVRMASPSPPASCSTGTNAVPGSESCGTGVHPSNGASYGEVTLDASGAVNFSFTDVNDLGVVTSETGTGTFTVEPQCFGISGGVRLDFDDATCTGGRKLDMVIVSDASGEVAKLFIGDGGEVLTFFDPKSIDPAATGVVGLHRSLGYAVRIR